MRSIDRSNDRSIRVSQALFAFLVTRRLEIKLKLRLVEEYFLQTLSSLTAGISLRTNSRLSNAHNFLYFDYHSQPLFCRHFLYLLLSHLKFKFRVDPGVSKALRMPMKKLKRYFSWYEWCIGKFIPSYSLGGCKTIRRQYRQIGLVIVLHTDRGSHLRVHAIDRSGYLKH